MNTNPNGYSCHVASRDAPAAQGDDLDRVIAQVANILATSIASRDEREQAIDVLRTVKTTPATAALQRAAHDPDMPLQLRAAVALLERDDISTLNTVVSVLLHPSPRIERGLVARLAFAIQDGVQNPQAIPALARLLQARDAQMRRSAATALRHTGATAAIEPLWAALRDSDSEVRYQAVLGLATITGQQEWGPSRDLFERQEPQYLTYWREWIQKGR
jgi:HEAT repeat protein